MAKDSWLSGVFSFIAPMFHSVIGDIKQAAEDIMTMIEQRVHSTVRTIVKGIVIFLMLALGLIFVLVGVSTFLDAVLQLVPGAGLMIVGGALILLGVFAYVMSK